MPFQDYFDLDIPTAIHSQLTAKFEELEPIPLARIPKLDVSTGTGVYGLYHVDRLVYVGKAGNLHNRLVMRRLKVSGRKNLSDNTVSFCCLTVNPNWAAYAPEGILIGHYSNQGLCEWNGSGFGSNDPGRNRERTNKPTEGFDKQFPIRDDWPCNWLPAGTYQVTDLLVSLKKELPFLLRYERSEGRGWRDGHEDFDDKEVVLPDASMSAREILTLVVEVLSGWQATIFPSHIILYKERRTYLHGESL